MRVTNRTKAILVAMVSLGLILPAAAWAAAPRRGGPRRAAPPRVGPGTGPRAKAKAAPKHLPKAGLKPAAKAKAGLKPAAKAKRIPPPAIRPRLRPHPVARLVLPPFVPRMIVRTGGNLVIQEGTTVVSEVVPSDVVVAADDLAVLPTDAVTTETTWEVIDLRDDYLVTLQAGEEQITVRLVGIDPPLVAGPENTPTLPEEARRFAQNLLLHEFVYLESDPNLAEEDADGNRVGYLYRVPDKMPLNLELVRQGYALAAQGYSFQYQSEFQTYQRKAQADRKGLWSTLSEAPEN